MIVEIKYIRIFKGLLGGDVVGVETNEYETIDSVLDAVKQCLEDMQESHKGHIYVTVNGVTMYIFNDYDMISYEYNGDFVYRKGQRWKDIGQTEKGDLSNTLEAIRAFLEVYGVKVAEYIFSLE